MILKIIFLSLFFFGTISMPVRADEFHSLFLGTRALAMGGAFTAVADDEQAIFYNPAGLAGVKSFSFKLATLDADISNDLLSQYAPISAAISNPSISSINTLMGKNIYVRGQASATLMIPGFGVTAFYDQQGAIRIQNPSLPSVTFAGQTTYGGQLAVGFTVLKLKKKKGELRLGAAGKLLWRGGGFQHPSLTQLLTANLTSMTTNLSNMGIGYGADVGMQFIYNVKKKLNLMAGLAFTDLGDTSFASPADAQKSNMTFGLAVRYANADVVATLSYDYAHILDYADSFKKNHLGLELKFPMLTLYSGLNQLYVTYGAGLDLGIVKIMYVSYGEELGSVAGVNGERRNLVHAALKFDL